MVAILCGFLIAVAIGILATAAFFLIEGIIMFVAYVFDYIFDWLK